MANFISAHTDVCARVGETGRVNSGWPNEGDKDSIAQNAIDVLRFIAYTLLDWG